MRRGLASAVALLLVVGVIGVFVTSARRADRVPHAPVSASQVTALETFEDHHIATSPGVDARVSCAIDVLGARMTPDGIHVWTMATCVGERAHCNGVYDASTGLVADIAGNTVENAQYDDRDDGTDLSVDHTIYPRGLWSRENGLLNSDGSPALRAAAVKMSGCPANV